MCRGDIRVVQGMQLHHWFLEYYTNWPRSEVFSLLWGEKALLHHSLHHQFEILTSPLMWYPLLKRIYCNEHWKGIILSKTTSIKCICATRLSLSIGWELIFSDIVSCCQCQLDFLCKVKGGMMNSMVTVVEFLDKSDEIQWKSISISRFKGCFDIM